MRGDRNSFVCWLMGSGPILVECGDRLLLRGHQVAAVIATDLLAEDWANRRRIPCTQAIASLMAGGTLTRPDYLFSIASGTILNKEELGLARRMSINLHTSPLPKYAGVNQACWAIFNGELQYGITWHCMQEKIDGGGVLLQAFFRVAEDETTLSLNVKCHSAGVNTFTDLLLQLERDTVQSAPQDLSKRTYFGRTAGLPHAGIISWDMSAHDIERICRACDHGSHGNRFGVLKILLDSGALILRHATVVRGWGGPPGAVQVTNDDAVLVATSRGALRLDELLTLDGEPVEVLSAVGSSIPGARLPMPAPQVLQQAGQLSAQVKCYEEAWMNELSTANPVTLPGFENVHANDSLTLWKIPVDSMTKRILATRMGPTQEIDIALGGWLALFVDESVRPYSVLWSAPDLRLKLVDNLASVFAMGVPLTVSLSSAMSFDEIVDQVRRQRDIMASRQTFLLDLVARFPGLPRGKPWIVFGQDRYEADPPPPGVSTAIYLNSGGEWSAHIRASTGMAEHLQWELAVAARRVQQVISYGVQFRQLPLLELLKL